jgi:hypothetical protein
LTTPTPAETTVRAGGLFVVALLRHGLPIGALPKQRHVAAMRDDMIDYLGDGDTQLASHAVRALTERMRGEVRFAGLLPSVAVAALGSRAALLVLLGLALLAVRITETRWADQRLTAGVAAWRLGSEWHGIP